METLNNDVMEIIFTHLSLRDILSLTGTNKAIRALISDMNHYWYKLVRDKFLLDQKELDGYDHPSDIDINCLHTGNQVYFVPEPNKDKARLFLLDHILGRPKNVATDSRKTVGLMKNIVIEGNLVGPYPNQGGYRERYGLLPLSSKISKKTYAYICFRRNHWVPRYVKREPEYRSNVNYFYQFRNLHVGMKVAVAKNQVGHYTPRLRNIQNRIYRLQKEIKEQEEEKSYTEGILKEQRYILKHKTLKY